jgi:hydroxymethylpyrimidine pyrophosphatase-like HAD family hydrolase
MSDAALVMDQRIVWDATNKHEVEEAKQTILKYKRLGYKIILADGRPFEKFRPTLEQVVVKAERVFKQVMKILTDKGDERLTWDRDNGLEAMEAKKKFEEFIGKGYKAYSVDTVGKKQRRIEEFDVDAEEILMVPPTVKG